MDGKVGGKDRRKAENSLLRELVDALKRFIAARDAIWGLSFVDRLFRKRKCRQIFAEYEDTAAAVKGAIREIAKGNYVPQPDFSRQEPLISLEEFEALMSKPGTPIAPSRSGKGRKKTAAAPRAQELPETPENEMPEQRQPPKDSAIVESACKAAKAADGLSILDNPFDKRRKLI